jgi:hypothetical protein
MASDYRMTADNCTLLALQMQCLVTEMFLALAHRLVMSTFKDSIARIGGLLLVVDAWDNPKPLRRAWYADVVFFVLS